MLQGSVYVEDRIMQPPRAKEITKSASKNEGYEERPGRKMKAPASFSSKLRITVDEFR